MEKFTPCRSEVNDLYVNMLLTNRLHILKGSLSPTIRGHVWKLEFCSIVSVIKEKRYHRSFVVEFTGESVVFVYGIFKYWTSDENAQRIKCLIMIIGNVSEIWEKPDRKYIYK